MPSKNRLKTYIKDAHYHIYNRGVAKQKIFLDLQDYKVFLKYLRESLSDPKGSKVTFILKGQTFKGEPRQVKNFKDKIEILAFCLMPNHFHILLKQNDKNSMEGLMRSLITRYAQFFNKKYDRVGHLFQGRYKAVLVLKDGYILHLTRYIHLNPQEIQKDLTKAFSSYQEYLGLKVPDYSSGVLQDVHWSNGNVGYFPTYSLGTILSTMWKYKLEKNVDKISELVKNTTGVRKIQDWLRKHVHQYGSTFVFKELVKKTCGEDFNSRYFIEYLNRKYKELY